MQLRTDLDTVIGEGHLVDFVALAVVPVALVAVHLLPETVQSTLVLDRGSPTPVTMFTSHFVHADYLHFRGNLVAYFLVMVPTYLLCLLSGEGRRFWTYFLVLIAVFPFLLSAMDLAIFGRHGLNRGFSGLNAAFLGFLPVALTVFLKRKVNTGFELRHSLVLFSLYPLMVPLIYWKGRPVDAALLAAIALLLTYFLHRVVAEVGTDSLRETLREIQSKPRVFFLVCMSIGIFITGVPAMFPTTLVERGNTVNIYIHHLGFALGFTVPYTTWRWSGNAVDHGPDALK